MAELVLRFLGGFEALLGSVPASGFESDKARGLLAYLAVKAGRAQRREILAGLLWPELTEQAARANLRRVLSNVRDVIGDREVEPPLLIISRQAIQFNEEANCRLDTADLEFAVKAAQLHSSDTDALEAALAGYKGEFLAGFTVPDSISFEQWLLERREHYRQLLFKGLERLVNRYEAYGNWDAALGAARRQLAIDPTREEGQRQAMRLLALMGDRSGALAQYESCCAILDDELGVEPEEATTALYEQIIDGSLEWSMPASWGEALRGYEIREQIGSGAFGIVYRAYQPIVDRQVAVKVIRPEFANRPDFIRRFEVEARLVARLDHLHIVPLYDYWRDADGAYLVMRWLRGGSLQQSLQNDPWPPPQAALLLDQIAEALAYAHRRGVVHGDVRAENILLDEAGNAYLSDFGIARDQIQSLPMPQLEQSETISGSVLAITPEQVTGSPATPQSDQYCLGMVLFQVLVGKSLLAGKTPQEQLALVGQRLPPLEEIRPDLPPDLNTVLQRATARQPDGRYEDVLSLATDFRAALGETDEAFVTHDEDAGERLSPNKGLRPSVEMDAVDFYGREALMQQLLARMEEDKDLARLLTTIDPSDSGKLSVINEGVISPQHNAFGKSYEEWVVKWWQWMFSLPADGNHPMLSEGEVDCNYAQDGEVWFLAGAPGKWDIGINEVVRNCTAPIPPGKALFFPVGNMVSTAYDEDDIHFGSLENCANIVTDNFVIPKSAQVDGREIDNLEAYRTISPAFDFSTAEPPLWYPPFEVHRGVSGGYYLFLAPLSEGEHHIWLKWGIVVPPVVDWTTRVHYHFFVGQ